MNTFLVLMMLIGPRPTWKGQICCFFYVFFFLFYLVFLFFIFVLSDEAAAFPACEVENERINSNKKNVYKIEGNTEVKGIYEGIWLGNWWGKLIKLLNNIGLEGKRRHIKANKRSRKKRNNWWREKYDALLRDYQNKKLLKILYCIWREKKVYRKGT